MKYLLSALIATLTACSQPNEREYFTYIEDDEFQITTPCLLKGNTMTCPNMDPFFVDGCRQYDRIDGKVIVCK